jgi:hypothetical protein
MKNWNRPDRLTVGLSIAALLSGAAAASAEGGSEAPWAAAIRGKSGKPAVRVVVNFREMAGVRLVAPPRRSEEADEPRFVAPTWPLPQGASLRMEAAPVRALARPSALPPSPAPASSFEALSGELPVTPPDAHGAVGPNHIMVTLNTEVRIQDRDGTPLLTMTLSQFWQSAAAFSGAFDPRVFYDSFADRWIVTSSMAARSAQSALLIGASQTGDPTGRWNLYRIDADAADLTWLDYPTVGFNKTWVVVQGQMFIPDADSLTDFGLVRTQIWAISKASLYAGQSVSFTLFSTDSIGYGQCPAVTLDPSLADLFLLQNWNGNENANGVLRLYKISGAVGSEVLTPVAFIGTADPWDSIQPNRSTTDMAPQKGSPYKIDTGDSLFTSVVFRNGSIWAAHTIFLPAGLPTRSAIQWWQLTPAGDVIQRGRVDDPSGRVFRAFPSLAVNKNGDLLLSFTSYSADQYPAASYAYRAAADPRGAIRSDVALKAGEKQFEYYGGGKIRWGDYSATSVDPANDTDFWTIQEYVKTSQPVTLRDRWGTWWGRVVPEAAEGGAPCIAAATVLCLNGNRFQVDVAWRVPSQGTAGVGTAVAMTGDTGFFWFFSSSNVELVLKVLDGRAINGKFWVFFGALSNVEYTITVTDTETGAMRRYFNPFGQQASVSDTGAF